MNRGQSLLAVIMWAGGISLSTIGLASSIVSGQFNRQDDMINSINKDVTGIGTRVTVVETRIERLPFIEAKLNELLIQGGINPYTIEKRVESLATSTSSAMTPIDTF